MAQNAGDLAQKILAQARRKADAAEIIYQESESRGVSFQDNRLKTVSASAARGVGLRIIHRGRIGFSSTNDLDSVDTLIANALDSAAFGQEAKFQFPGDVPQAQERRVCSSAAHARVQQSCTPYNSQSPLLPPLEGQAQTAVPHEPVKVFDDAVPKLSMERAAELMRGGIETVLQHAPEAHCGGGISSDYGLTVICNSVGLHHEELSSTYEMDIGAFLVRGESFLSVDEGEESSRYSGDIQRHARKVAEWLRLSEKEVRLGEEELPVLFTPRALDFLLNTFEINTNGKLVQKGASILANRLGERVLDERISLWDDPLVDYASGSMSMDAEGVPARRNALFEKGVLKNFLYDLQTASMMNTQTTGNGMRGYSSLPRPGTTNLRLSPGMEPFEKVLRSIKRGILLDAALGAGQSNVLAGEFSVNVELGFLIENGEIVGRVKDCMLAGNAFDAFNRIRAVSAETEWHGAFEAPAVCFEGLNVAG